MPAGTSGATATVQPVGIASLEIDLDVFSGPFDLLLTLVLREEVDLLELALADVVVAYLDHLEQRGELDLEAATEFIVLIAALLELKSRLMLSGEEEELLDIEPEQAAEELLARMLDAARYRAAAGHLRELLAAEDGVRFRAAPLPPALRRRIVPPADGSERPDAARARRSAGCSRCRRRSACATSARPASASPSASRTCAGCCAAAPSASTRPSAAPTA